jgi:hypothetical protein
MSWGNSQYGLGVVCGTRGKVGREGWCRSGTVGCCWAYFGLFPALKVPGVEEVGALTRIHF